MDLSAAEAVLRMLTRSRDVAVVEASCSIRSFGLHPRRIADHKDVDISEEEERPKWTCLAKAAWAFEREWCRFFSCF